MTDNEREKNLEKLKHGELRREVVDLWKRIELKDAEIAQLQETVHSLVESGSDYDEIMDMRKKASQALKNALEEADNIIKEARDSADKILEHARMVRETVNKEAESSGVVLPGSSELLVSDDLLMAKGTKKAEVIEPGSSFAEYFMEKPEPAKVEEPVVEVVEEQVESGDFEHVFEEYVEKHEIALPPIVSNMSTPAVCAESTHHVFDDYVEEHQVVLPPRVVENEEEEEVKPCCCCCNKAPAHVYEEYVVAPVVEEVQEEVKPHHHVFEEYVEEREEIAVIVENNVSVADGWRELLDSLHK